MARYRMRQKLISMGDDFTIEDASGNPAFEVDGKFLSLRDTFDLKDLHGNVLVTLRGKLMSIRAKMDILRNGEVAATVTKAIFAPLRAKFSVEIAGGEELRIDGSIFDHEYEINRGDNVIAQVSKRWFTFADTYGIDIADGEDDALILAIAVAVDEMAHDDKSE